MKKAGVVILATMVMVTLMAIGSLCSGGSQEHCYRGPCIHDRAGCFDGQPSKHGYQLGADMINAKGGVYVKEYGKKIPLELVFQDMETNPEKAIGRARL